MKRISIFISTILLYINSYAQQNWLQVECGTEFSIALRSDSALFSWGVNTNGQLGNNLATPSSTSPYLIDTNSKWRAISAGSFHSLGIKNNGTLWTWGFNGNGQLGTGSLLQEDVPVQIGTDSDWKSIDAGLANSFAIKNNGTLWVCGLNFHGQLGIGAAGADTSVLIQVGTDNTWKQISCGGLHVMGLKNNGTLWSWGYNGEGQVGDTTNFNKPSPVQITAATNWQSISAGYQFSTAIKTDGSIFSWGFNGNGQLGDNTTTQRNFPLDISAAETWNSISAGASFAYAIKSDSTLYSWGFNGAGQLGSGNLTQYNKPTLVDNATNWLTINAADGGQSGAQLFGLHALGLKSDRFGICYSGANYTGQLGNGTTANSSVFVCNQITTGLEEFKTKQLEVSIYPNPTNDFITLEIPGLEFETVSYQLINSLGQQVMTRNISQYSQINMSTLDNGLYLLLLSDGNQIISSSRVIKN